ncbi:MAG: DUF892 family protein [Armatimonas sp.]
MSKPTDETPQQKVLRYIDDAIALESASITALKDMADDAKLPEEAALYQEHLKVSEQQKVHLEERMTALGGELKRNVLKDLMNSVGAAATDLLHAAKDDDEKATRNLMQCYAIESLEVSVYEALASAAEATGDAETAKLAAEIQKEEQQMQSAVFSRVKGSSKASVLAAPVA